MRRLILILVFVLAFVLRLALIDSLPSGFTPDEASFGYDAYSLLKTGKDQWGKSFPLVFESFGDYKSPLYTYLAIPTVALFGLNPFAVRLPNALLGSLSVILIYFLIKSIKSGAKKEIEKDVPFDLKLEEVGAIFLAFSPWHIMLSRGAFEANLVTFLVPLGIYLFLKSKYNLSAFVFGISLFSYHSGKLLAPIVFITLLLIFKFKRFIPIAIFSILLALSIYTQLLGGGTRVAERSITAGALEEGARIKIELISKGTNPIIARLLHNKYQVTASRFLANYRQYLSTRFLFTKGAGETTYGMVPGTGVLYLIDALFLLGLVPIILKKETRLFASIVVAWMLVGPIPAALASGVGYSGNRAAGMMPALEIICAIGFFGFIKLFSKYKRQIALVTAVLFVISVVNFTTIYFSRSALLTSEGMLYGNLEMATVAGRLAADDRDVVVSTSLSEPHIYMAFANSWDPKMVQEASKGWNYKERGVNWVDQMPVYNFERVIFRKIVWKDDVVNKEAVFFGRPDEFPVSVAPDRIIYYPNGKPAIYEVHN